MRETPLRVEKPWGYEDILERNQDFVVKRILLRAGNRSSLQLHERKREWVEVVEGTIELTIGTDEANLETRELTAGDVYRVPPKTIHRVLAIEDALILEICTPGDDDIIRLDDDYGRRGQHATQARRLAWPVDRPARPSRRRSCCSSGCSPPAVLVGFAPAVSLPQLHFMHSDAFELHDVARIYVEAWDSPGFDPFATGAIRLATVLAALVYLTLGDVARLPRDRRAARRRGMAAAGARARRVPARVPDGAGAAADRVRGAAARGRRLGRRSWA